MILVVCALAPELRYFTPRRDVEIVESGVGPVEAAVATARALSAKRYAAVINAGIGGSFRGDRQEALRVGEAAIVETEWLADLGLEGGGTLDLPGGAQLFERERASDAFVRIARTLEIAVAVGVTVAQVTATDATAERLRTRYGADVESMEGFSVLRAAAVAGVPALEVRGISNYVGARATSEWDFAAGARATARALETLLTAIGT